MQIEYIMENLKCFFILKIRHQKSHFSKTTELSSIDTGMIKKNVED